MPKIDAMLQMMSSKNVGRAILTADKPYQVWVGTQRIERTVTPAAQLRAIVEEIVPAQLGNAWKNGGTCGFEHVSSYGTFDVGVSHDLGALKLTISPKSAQAIVPHPAPNIAPVVPPPPPIASALPSMPPPSPPQVAPQSIVPAPAYPAPYPNAPPGYYPPQPQGDVHHHHYNIAPVVGRSPRSRIVAGLLGLLLPGLGIHRFYLGYTGAGICYLLMTLVFVWLTCGFSAYIAIFIGFIEGIIILCGGMNDAEGRPLSA